MQEIAFAGCIQVQTPSEAVFVEAGAPEARDVRFAKFLDSTSLPLRQAMLQGTALPSATLRFRKPGMSTGTITYSSIKLSPARVTSMATLLGAEPSEAVSLSGERLEYMFRKQGIDGSLLPPGYVCWEPAAGTVTNAPCP